jgi:Kef-type K+ transport system membrane component KefB
VFAEQFIFKLGIMISVAAIVAMTAQRVKMPSIIAYILAGLTLGPVTGLVAVEQSIEIIAEVGIVLLLFLVGLELSLHKIKDVGMVALVTGGGQMALTLMVFFGLSFGLGFSAMEAALLGVALMFSSTVVVVKLLEQSKRLDSLFGRISVGVLLVQDLAVILALTFVSALGRGGDDIAVSELLTQIGLALVGMGAMLAMAFVCIRFLLPRPFGWMSRSREGLFIWSLALCFVFVELAHLLQLSVEIGAFLAGLCLAQMPYNHELQRQVHPLTNLFIAIFFVTLGIQMELEAALNNIAVVAVFIGLTLVAKPVIIYLLIVKQGFARRTAFMSAVTLAQVSEFGFIFMALAIGTGLASEALMSTVAMVGLVTISVSAVLYGQRERLFDWFNARGWLGQEREADRNEPAPEEPMSDHIILVGLNDMGRAMARELHAQGHTVLAIDTDLNKLKDLPCETMMGHAENVSVLHEAGLERAKLIISTLRIEETNKMLTFRACRAGVPISVHGFERKVTDELVELGADHVLIPKDAAYRHQLKAFSSKGVIQ